MDDLFGVPLRVDPAVALKIPTGLPAPRIGPLHRIQFVIELVGPRTVPANVACWLNEPQWHQPLGQPTVYAMTPRDDGWNSLTTRQDGSYDSLALTWDLLTDRGNLSTQAAKHLFQTAEAFASQIQRRALAMPIADEVDRRVKELTTLRDNLDTGFSLLVFPRSGAFLERDIWVQATRLGLEFRSDDGLFHWGEVGYPPLFTLSSLTKDEFSLAAVQTNTLHQGLQLGFSLPRCPAPSQSFLGVCSAAEELARQLNGLVLDDAQRVFDQPSRSAAERNIAMASATLTQAGLAPGSTEAIRIWQDCLQLGSCHQLPKEQMP